MIVEMTGNIWELARPGDAIVITTNGDINAQGKAVMGRGIAKQAAMLEPNVPTALAAHINENGNVPGLINNKNNINWFTLPVKHHWFEVADINLIRESIERLSSLIYDEYDMEEEEARFTIWMPRPGCGNGRLKWEEVKPVIAPYLEDIPFVVVNYG